MKDFIKFVSIMFLFFTLLNYYTYVETSVYLELFFKLGIIVTLVVLFYAMLKDINRK